MKRHAAFVCVGLLACGGGGDDLTLVLAPDTVVANGTDVVQLRAEIEFRGEALPDGQRVTFAASLPLLFESRDAVVAEVEGGRPEGQSLLEIRTQGGRATAFILAPVDDDEPLTVTASYTTVNQDALEELVTVDVRPPPLVASGRPGAAGCDSNEVAFSADQLGFAFACNRRNVGAFIAPREPIEVECQLVARTADGAALPHVPVALFAEAGELVDRPATRDAPRRIVHRVPTPLIDYPRDVTAAAAEQTLSLVEVGGSPIPGALDSNPRDGLVTLLAVVRGHEAFFDSNDNGVYDPGEPYCDEGEPFVDVDDDGVYDPAIDRACCDGNGNGVVDGRNGRWDSDVPIGRMAHVLWTGGPARARISPNPSTVPAQGAENVELFLVDASFNPIAAGAAGDAITFDTSPSGRVSFSGGVLTEVSLPDTLGMELREGFPRFVFGAQQLPVFEGFSTGSTAPPERFGRSYAVALQDARSGTALCDAASFELEAEIRATPAPDYGSVRFDPVTTRILASGQVEALAGACPP